MSKPVRVLQLIKSLGRGGAEMLLPETLRFADRERFSYRFAYFLPRKDAMVSELEAQGVPVDCVSASNPLSILLSSRRVADCLREWEIDVLHCHLPLAGIVGRIAGRLASVPVVYTEHNVLERYHPITRRANVFTWSWQEGVIAVSAEVAESLRKQTGGGVPVKVVLNGVDVARFDPARVDAGELRRRLGIPPQSPVVATVAVFRAQKRLDHWLEAGRRILERYPEAHFILVGDGPLRDELEERAESMEMNGNVHWVGLQTDVRPYLAASDVYMMSSQFEGLPVALLEAMSMRCAVACTAVGGIPEVIRDGENGLLVEPGNPDRLAEAASRILADDAEGARMGDAARESVKEKFSVERMTREIEATYADVIREYANGG